jgi:hypothetical protein
MPDVQQLQWTLEEDASDKNFALFVTVQPDGRKVQMSAWLDSPQAVLKGLAVGLEMNAPPVEAPE